MHEGERSNQAGTPRRVHNEVPQRILAGGALRRTPEKIQRRRLPSPHNVRRNIEVVACTITLDCKCSRFVLIVLEF